MCSGAYTALRRRASPAWRYLDGRWALCGGGTSQSMHVRRVSEKRHVVCKHPRFPRARR